jgi:hypothetical protein
MSLRARVSTSPPPPRPANLEFLLITVQVYVTFIDVVSVPAAIIDDPDLVRTTILKCAVIRVVEVTGLHCPDVAAPEHLLLFADPVHAATIFDSTRGLVLLHLLDWIPPRADLI